MTAVHIVLYNFKMNKLHVMPLIGNQVIAEQMITEHYF